MTELQTFVAVVEEGSLVAASHRLGVSANAVSRRLSTLEERFERRLIHRSTRKLRVTDEGRRFYERCNRVLQELYRAEQELCGENDEGGTLRIGLHAGIVSPTIIEGVAHLLESMPRLRVQIRVTNSYLEPIGAGLDMAVYVGRPPSSSLISVRLGVLQWGLYAAPSYISRHGEPDTPDELKEHECLRLLRNSPETHWSLRRGTGRSRKFEVGGRFETTDAQTLSAALHAGIGIGLQLKSAVATHVDKGTLVPILPGWHWNSTPIYALLPEGRTKLPVVREMLEILKRSTTLLDLH